MIDLVVKILSGLGVLAMIYRLYLALSGYKEKIVESKNSAQVQKDKEADSKDASTIKNSTDAFNKAVEDFEKDNK